MFDQVPGGTFVGNLIRSIASNVTGGIAGQGEYKINADGSVGNGSNDSLVSDMLASGAYILSQTADGQKIIKDSGQTYATAQAKNNWFWLITIAALSVALIVSLNKK